MTDAEIALQRRAARLVEREVHACMSSLVATLAKAGGGAIHNGRGTNPYCDDTISGTMALADRALELAAPVPDYEGAAREAGWIQSPTDWRRDEVPANEWSVAHVHHAATAQAACEHDGIEPHGLEIYEHWAVSQWLAEKLVAKGERVDTDFAGLNVWARTTTGQAISADSVIEKIAEATGYASAI